MQVWVASEAGHIFVWAEAKEGHAHPVLEDTVLSWLGDMKNPRWIRKGTQKSYAYLERRREEEMMDGGED